MRVELATEPGTAGRVNEDFAAVVPGVAVLLDGAGTPGGQDSGCKHGVAWYARTLGGLLAAGASDASVPLREVTGRGIEQVSQMHAGTCDLGSPFTPSATVVITRQAGDTLEYLLLCDSVLLLQHRSGEARAITDARLEHIAAKLRPGGDLPTGTPERDAAWQAYAAQVEAGRNHPGRFWVAAVDPDAAAHALEGTEPLYGLSAVALLSDGASRLADRFGLMSWNGACDILAGHGPAGLIAQVRAAEAGDPEGRRWPRNKISDDATVIYWRTSY